MDPRIGTATPEELLAHASFLQRISRELVADAHAAADLAQDTWVAALDKPPRHDGSLRGWFGKVATNLARNAGRSTGRRRDREARVARAESVESEGLPLERLEVQRALLDLLIALPEEQRTVLHLRYYEGLTPSEIAERLAVPLKTVKTRHTRGIAALRERLDARSNGDRRRWLGALVPLAIPGAASSTVATVIGGLIVKKLALAALAVVLALLSWWTFARFEPGGLRSSRTDSFPMAALDAESAPPTPLDVLATAPTNSRHAIATERSTQGALDVRLSWSDGTPAAEIGIVARSASDPAPRAEYERAVTDAQGLAHFPDLHAGDVTLRPDLREPFRAAVEAGLTNTIEHTLPVGLDVAGRVVGPDGAAVGAASIWCDGEEKRNSQMRFAVACGEDSSFRLRDVSERGLLGARARGFRASPCVTPGALTVGADGARTVELRLEPGGGRVHGRVLDPDGLPLARARVLAGPRGGHSVKLTSGVDGTAPSPAAVETAADGSFELLDSFEPGEHPINAAARGYPLWSGSVVVGVGVSTLVEIRLLPPARVEGRVLDFDGRPIAGVDVLAAEEVRGGWYWHVFPPPRTRSDADGRFELQWIPPGPCELNAHDNPRPQIGRARGIVECASDVTTTCELRLDRGNVIAGRVEDTEGAPIAGWSVHADTQMRESYPRHTTTAEDGSFTILNLGKGAFDLAVRGPDRGAPRARVPNVRVGTTDVVIVAANAHAGSGSLRGRMVDPDARSLEDVVATLWQVGQREGHFVEFDAGTGSFDERTQPGRYRLNFRRGERALLTTPVFVVEEDRTCELGDVEFQRPGRVEIALAPGASDLLADLGLVQRDLELSLEAGDAIMSDRADLRNGLWIAEHLRPGTWSIFLTARLPTSRRGDSGYDAEVQHLMQVQRFAARGVEFEVRSAETTRVELALERAFEVPLVLVGSDSEEFTIDARDADGRLLGRWRIGFGSIEERQRFTLQLPAGRARIEARSGVDRTGRAEVTAVAVARDGPPTEIVLRKEP